MADYGLIVKNYDEEVVIDGTYQNYSLNDFGNMYVYQDEEGGLVEGVSSFASAPIFAIKADATYYNSQDGFSKSGSNYANPHCWPEADYTMYWRSYKPGPSAALPSYGLIVKNASDDVVFSSEDTWLKIVSFNSTSVAYGAYSDITVTDATNNYFVLTNPVWDIRSVDNGAPDFDWTRYSRRRGIKRINSTTVRVGTYIWHSKIAGGDYSDSSWVSACDLIEIGA